MRFLWVLVMGLLVLPIAGCAKKKDPAANQTAANDQTSNAGGYEDDDDDTGYGDDAMDDDPMLTDDSPDGGHADDDDGMDDMFADADDFPNDEGFDDDMSDAGTSDGPPDDMPEVALPGEVGDDGMPDAGDSGLPAEPPSEGSEESKPGWGTRVLNFFTGGGDQTPKPMPNPGQSDDGMPIADDGLPGDADDDDGIPGDEGFADDDGGVGEAGLGEGGSNQPVRKPSELSGVKEGTAEYAAASLILKVANGETEGLESLIAQDANGLLKKLRSDPDEDTLEEAKELMGQVKHRNTRLADRDTVFFFQNANNKILQFYVRRVGEGKYVVRELRVSDAAKQAPPRRQASPRGRRR